MVLSLLKVAPIQAKTKTYALFAFMLAMVVMSVLMPETAMAATYDVTEIGAEFDDGEQPVGAVASASAEMLVVRRIWRIIKSSI